ncbi:MULTISPECIES: DUF7168 domain-containing protein [Cysteiniphilum]|uniref:DUF7168 domain-containing protein n=1 Tax=Cysteiniphilum TaxID=2056696 RepID=UPI00177DE9EB|nr:MULTISPECIES: hypothetical protein [Cysteiniphilum]
MITDDQFINYYECILNAINADRIDSKAGMPISELAEHLMAIHETEALNNFIKEHLDADDFKRVRNAVYQREYHKKHTPYNFKVTDKDTIKALQSLKGELGNPSNEEMINQLIKNYQKTKDSAPVPPIESKPPIKIVTKHVSGTTETTNETQLSAENISQLTELAQKNDTDSNTLLGILLENEASNIDALEYMDKPSHREDQLRRYFKGDMRKLELAIAESFCDVDSKSDISAISHAINKLVKKIAHDRSITQYNKSAQIIETDKVKVDKNKYYYYGSLLAKCVSVWLNTQEIYFEPGMYHHEHAVMFIGMPYNAQLSKMLFDYLYQLFSEIREQHHKSLHHRLTPRNKTLRCNQFMYSFAKQLEYLDAYIGMGTETDHKALCDYEDKHYRFLNRF